MCSNSSISVTIRYPISMENEQIKNETKKYNVKILNSGNLRELNFRNLRYELKDFENILLYNKIPYDLYEYARDFGTPKVKKVRPAQNYSKQINCLLFTGQEDGDEDGLISVSNLIAVIKESKESELVKNLYKLINDNSFKQDNILDIDKIA